MAGNPATPGLQRFQIFQQCIFLHRRQGRAEHMALVPVRTLAGVVAGSDAFGVGAPCQEAHVDRIVNIVAAPEYLRTLRRRFQQVAQRRHRAVVQVRRAQPEAIEERRVVAHQVLLDETLALYTEVTYHAIGGDRIGAVPGADTGSVGVDAGLNLATSGCSVATAAS